MNTINAEMVRKMFLAGAGKLDSQKERINELNVFPVPDGDTGTNMTLTIMSAAEEVQKIKKVTMSEVTNAISKGSLRGARGNSGVIFSQLCRGFVKEVENLDEIDAEAIARAAQRATETAYKAVMKPKEGTILTVAKGVSDICMKMAKEETTDVETMLEMALEHAQEVLLKTPEMLPVLKEAGVVDSGGEGLVCVLHGFLEALTGKDDGFVVEGKIEEYSKSKKSAGKLEDEVEITFGYCTEYIIKLEKEFTEKDEEDFKDFLNGIGDSIVCVAFDDIVKIHVHTDHPGEVFERGLTYGQLTCMKIDNMREEHENRVVTNAEVKASELQESVREQKKEPPVEVAFIAVAPGSGISELFKDMGASGIIEGGQTMNPSTNDILEAIENINANNVFVIPNNSNIILAANQAAELVEDKNVIVVPTKTVPQGIAAVVAFDPAGDVESNKENMTDAICYVKSGEVTYAVRDTMIDGKEVKKGDYIAINDDGLAASEGEIFQAIMKMLEGMAEPDSELVTIYYGAEVTEADANTLADMIREKYPEYELEIQSGGQPVYYYILSVE